MKTERGIKRQTGRGGGGALLGEVDQRRSTGMELTVLLFLDLRCPVDG